MTIYKFSTIEAAESFRDRAEKPMMILLGDDGRYWVVSLADGESLIGDGYEAV